MKHGKKFFVGGLLNVAAGLGTAGYGIYQERQAKKKMAQADAMAEGPIRSQAARQRIAKQESNAQSAIDSALRAQATAASQIAQQGGSRGLVSATPGLIRATDLASQGAIDRYGQAGAASNLATEMGMAQSQNLASRLNMNRLQRAADAARTNTLTGITGALKGAAEIAGDIDFAKLAAKRKANRAARAAEAAAKERAGIVPRTQKAISEIRQDQIAADKQDIQEGLMKSIATTELIEPRLRDKSQFSITEEEVLNPNSVDNLLDEALVTAAAKAPMGSEGFFSKGGDVEEPAEKTPGKFDHDENPIDIVQEGAKIGEMTGGEYIFNPEQAEEMRKLSEEGDSELHQFIRKLLSKEQFQ